MYARHWGVLLCIAYSTMSFSQEYRYLFHRHIYEDNPRISLGCPKFKPLAHLMGLLRILGLGLGSGRQKFHTEDIQG